jgi:hypothetical protein
MHPLGQTLDESFHQPKEQKRRSSLDNSCLSAAESFYTLIQDIGEYELSYPQRQRIRRLSLNNSESMPITFLADLLPRAPKKELDEDFHSSSHRAGEGDRYQSSQSTKLEDGSGETEDTSAMDSMIELSESSMDDDDDDDSCDSFCDAEESEPANSAYLRKDLGASCFLDDDMYGDMEESEEDEEKILRRLPQSNERIQAALERVRRASKKTAINTAEVAGEDMLSSSN